MNLRTSMPNTLSKLPNDVAPLPLVEAHHLRRSYRQRYGEVIALAEASCTIHSRARIALVGRSGSGKSTLLHLLGGLDAPTAGTIAWPALGPRDMLRPAKVALLFQTQSLLPPLSVVENIELPLLLNHIDKETAQVRARATLLQMQLEHLADKLPEELSGGQAQQVAIARVLAHHPPLILADEPTGQLDHATAQRLLTLLLEALAGGESALVLATHDQRVAERLQVQWTMEHGILDGELM